MLWCWVLLTNPVEWPIPKICVSYEIFNNNVVKWILKVDVRAGGNVPGKDAEYLVGLLRTKTNMSQSVPILRQERTCTES